MHLNQNGAPMTKRRLLLIVLGFCAAAACSSPLWARSSRLSAAVALVNKGPAIEAFLQKPGTGYVQAYMRFGADFPDDVIVTLDQEWIESIARPLYVKGGDWMALVGVQRAGGVWVAGGTEATMNGQPSQARNWTIFDLKTRLVPDSWYRFRIEADFGTRHFKSFTIDGPNLSRTIDLSAIPLDYPNFMPFSGPTMRYFTAAMRSRDMMKTEGTPLVYFDDVEGGVIDAIGHQHVVCADSFEAQKTVGPQPVTSPTIDLNGYRQGLWYLERDEAVFRIQAEPFARSGTHVGVADANLK